MFHPIRRSSARVHVFNHTADKATAIGRRVNLHGLFSTARDRRGMDFGLPERAPRQCGHFARNAFDAQAVGAVRRNFHVTAYRPNPSIRGYWYRRAHLQAECAGRSHRRRADRVRRWNTTSRPTPRRAFWSA
ncbi:hypothetical protein BN1095_3780001 [Clostridioides difficile]|uniref:Uncharacterized protein n=1 Tax=Clostridioides difficile TaxID=1496 RepID=A0A069AWD4_CLODI|nr:hypothetical protein BN1095_3780001 [Clostridioides difficile]